MRLGAFLLMVVTMAGQVGAANVEAAVKTKEVAYKIGDLQLQGVAAWDDAAKGPRPLVVLYHEWWGLGPNVRKRAEMLAAKGYVAFAADMYGKGVIAKDHDEAAKLAGAQFGDRKLMRQRALAGLEAGKTLPQVDLKRIAAIGYCFGGTSVLELARMGVDIRGVASFHGNLTGPVPATAKPAAKILVLHGASDNFVNPAVPGFLEEMGKVSADFEFVSYGGAVHSFTVEQAGDDPKKGMAYNKQADERSWARMLAFFDEIFR